MQTTSASTLRIMVTEAHCNKLAGPISSFRYDLSRRTKDVDMVFDNHPFYIEWRLALERVAAAKTARDIHRMETREFETADAEYQAALAAYEEVARRA
jgi:hypothetical protein